VEPEDEAQATLFGDGDAALRVAPAAADGRLQALAAAAAARWGDRLHLGTSSWHFPGWQGLVWAHGHREAELSRHGLRAYAAHPLLRTVSLDRGFYRPLALEEARALAAQVPAAFRFVAKAPASLCDASIRAAGSGAATQANPSFLDPWHAVACLQPLLSGLGGRLGALVFQLSPLPRTLLADPAELRRRLGAVWSALQPHLPAGALMALELRDAALLTPALAATLRGHGVRACLGLHDRMPPIDEQLPMQRAMWPGDLVCRWNLQRGHRYEEARDAWAPFDRLQAPDVPTRTTLARVAAAVLDAGHRVFITINNKAEGSAPLSVVELAAQMLRQPVRRA
jgi:uncharacterized protein YecE (DUF72 family)